jgi:hypothetical protein
MARRRRRRAPRRRSRTRTITVYRSRGRRSRPRGVGRATTSNLKTKAIIAGGGAILGYLETKSAQYESLSAKLPVLGNRNISVGLAAHFLNEKFVKSKWLDAVSAAALVLGGYQLGAEGMQGGDWTNALDADSPEMAGYVDVADVDLSDPGL